MTRDEILNEPVGPRLNKWVAEYVVNQRWNGGHPIPGYGGKWSWPYPYSTSIAAAIEAMEEVAGKKFWSYRIQSSDSLDSGPLYWVTISHGGREVAEAGSRFGDMEDSLPLAICRAALLAKLQENQ